MKLTARFHLLAATLLLPVTFPAQAQDLPPLRILQLPNGQVQLSWPDPGEPLVLESSGDAGTRASWTRTADDPVLGQGDFRALFSTAAENNFWRLRRPDLVPPVFPAPSASPTVALGNVTRFRLSATDLSGKVTYSVEPNPLPEGAHLDENDVFTFRPVEGMAGDFAFQFVATDRWGNSISRAVTITVTLPAPGTPTGITGMVLDSDATVGGGMVPIVNARVGLLNAAAGVDTDTQGIFTLTGVPGGLQVLDIAAANALPGPGGAQYAGFHEHLRLIPGVMNVMDRPYFLPRLDASSLTQVVPGQTTGVINPNLNIAMTVGANTATVSGGGAFTGQLSITAVPDELAPAKLPDELSRGSLITIQPVGVTFTTPVPITFPNRDNLPPGSGTDLWSLDPKSGTFVIVGTGRVTPDGQFVETVTGGIRAADWHSTLPPQPCPENGGDDPDNHDPDKNCNGNSGSEVSLHSGGLRTRVALPPWSSAGAETKLQLVYNSRFAYPYIIVPYNAVNSVRAAVPPTISQQIDLGGARVQFFAAPASAARGGAVAVRSSFFYDTRRLSESIDEVIRMAFGFDASEMETGYYPYRALVMSNYQSSSIGASFNRRCTVINESKSPFGAGWTLQGLQKLYPVPEDENRYLIVNGSGAHQVFTKGATDVPFIIGGFSAARSGEQSFPQGGNYSTARAAVQTAFPQVSFQGLDTITPATLGLVDILVLSPITGPTTSTELTAAEQTALFNWVQSGGCALLCVDNDLGRAALNTADESLISPFGITSENSTGDVVFISPENSPITSGIFGNVSRYTRAFGGRKVISPGSWGRSIAIDPQGGIGLVEVQEDAIQNGSGQVLVVTDTHLFLNNGAAGGQINDDNHRFLLLNAIDSFLTTQEPPGADVVYRGPKGDFTRLLKKPDGSFARRYNGGVEVRFSATGQQTATVDRYGNTVAMAYDAQGRLISLTDTGGRSAGFNYVGQKLASIVDPAGRTTLLQHNAEGDLAVVTLPGGAARTFEYDARHLMIRDTGPDGTKVDREYDGCGRLVRTVWPDGTVREISAVASAAAPAPGTENGSEDNPVIAIRRDEVQGTFKTPAGLTTAKTNNFGQEIDVTQPSGRTIVDRDVNGLPTRTVLPTGEEFRRIFNRAGQELEVLDVVFNGRQQRSYEPNFNEEASYTDEFNRTWSALFDGLGNRTRITSPAGRHTDATFNVRGQITSLVPAAIPAGVSYGYNAAGAMQSISSGSGADARTSNFILDTAGNLSSLTNPLGEITTFAWSPAGDMLSFTEQGTRTVSISVNPLGQLAALVPPGRPEHRLSRDVLGRLAEYQPPAGGSPITFEHDVWGLSRISHGGRSIRYLRNAAGQVTRVIVGRGEFKFTFQNNLPVIHESPDGITEQVTWKGKTVERITVSGLTPGTMSTTLDPGHRVTQFQLNSRPAIGVTYEPDGRLASVGGLTFTHSAAEGHVTGSSLGVVSEGFTCTSFGELSGRVVLASGSPVASFNRNFDKLSRVATETETIGGTTTNFAFSYDAHGRLTSVTKNGAPWYSCVWNPNNCRTSLTAPEGARAATFDTNDRLLTDGSRTFTYNGSGQLAAIAGPQPLTLNCDEHGFLLSAVTSTGDQIQYALNPLGRRSVKIRNGTRVQAFLWGSFLRPQAELDASGAVVAEFVYGERANVPEYIIKGGSTFRLITDPRGSVRLVIDTASGQIVQRLDYSPWGEVLLDTAPGFQPFGFGGGLYDPDTRLVNFGMRDYDPAAGRFISRDPLLFDGGDTNFYTYCQGDPVNFTDSVGTAPTPENELEKKLRDAVGDKMKDEILKRLAKRAGYKAVGNFLAGGTGPQVLSKITTGWMTWLWFEGASTSYGDQNPYNPQTDPDAYTDYLVYYWAKTGKAAVTPFSFK